MRRWSSQHTSATGEVHEDVLEALGLAPYLVQLDAGRLMSSATASFDIPGMRTPCGVSAGPVAEPVTGTAVGLGEADASGAPAAVAAASACVGTSPLST